MELLIRFLCLAFKCNENFWTKVVQTSRLNIITHNPGWWSSNSYTSGFV